MGRETFDGLKDFSLHHTFTEEIYLFGILGRAAPPAGATAIRRETEDGRFRAWPIARPPLMRRIPPGHFAG